MTRRRYADWRVVVWRVGEIAYLVYCEVGSMSRNDVRNGISYVCAYTQMNSCTYGGEKL